MPKETKKVSVKKDAKPSKSLKAKAPAPAPVKSTPANPTTGKDKKVKADKKSKKVKEVAPPPPPPAESSDEDSEESSDNDVPVAKPQVTNGKAAAKAPPPKQAPKAVPKPAESESDSESDSSEEEKSKAAQVSAPKKAVAATKNAVVPTKKAESSDDSDSDSEDDEPPKTVPAKAVAAVKPVVDKAKSVANAAVAAVKPTIKQAATVVANAADSSDDDDSSDSDEEEVAKPKAAAPAPAAAKKTEESSSDDDSSDDSDEDGDVAMKDVATPAANGKANGKRKADEPVAAPAKKTKLDDDSGAAEGGNEESATVFVGRLSWSVDNDWLKSEFEQFGTVVSARVQMDNATGKSRGFGYVEFETPACAKAALVRNGQEIDGRPINVDLAIARGANPNARAKAFGDKISPASTTLFLGNLPWSATEDGLWEMFGDFGEIKSVRLPTDRESGKPKGFGYVEFTELDGAKKALEGCQGKDIDGRNLRIDYSTPRDNDAPRGGGRGGFGGDRGGRGGFGGGRGGFGGDRGGGRGRGRGGFGDRGGGRGGFGDRGGRGAPRGRGGARTGGIVESAGRKMKFD